MATLEQMITELDQTRAAMVAEDYVLARKKLTLARITLVGIPDTEMNEEKAVWQRNINEISKEIKQLENDQRRANSYDNSPIIFQEIKQVRE